MINLHIEHNVTDYNVWKNAFDSDPVGRQKSGVRAYRITRGVDSPDRVAIDLEFDTMQQAQGLLDAMQPVWSRAIGTLIHNPEWHFTEIVESHAF